MKTDTPLGALAELAEVNARVSAIQAPADGYVVEMAIKEGDTYEGAVDLMTLTAEGSGPVLRADISSLNRDVAEGSVVVLRSERGGTVETRVIASGTDDEGKKYVDAEITRDVTAAIGSVYSLLEKDVSMSLIYRASQNTTLIPSAAVQTSLKPFSVSSRHSILAVEATGRTGSLRSSRSNSSAVSPGCSSFRCMIRKSPSPRSAKQPSRTSGSAAQPSSITAAIR